MSDQQQDLAQEVLPINIEDELKQSYMDYAMSVIVGRALPDKRRGKLSSLVKAEGFDL